MKVSVRRETIIGISSGKKRDGHLLSFADCADELRIVIQGSESGRRISFATIKSNSLSYSFLNMTFARNGLNIRSCFAPMSKSTGRKQVRSSKE